MKLKDNYLFLIGGYDLEMLEIIKILEERNLPYVDKKLQWNTAKLSAYQELFDSSRLLVGIELREDVPPPKFYKSIDHHNERSNELASIEQLAELLEIELSRYQQLVAANDKGYIPAMLDIGASEEEIAEVRWADRVSQGVTEQDEKWAEEGIRQMHWVKGIAIVYTLGSRFSPVTDRLYGKAAKLIVYNEHTLNYYGQQVLKVAEHYREWIAAGKAYNGGGEAGYFGLNSGAFDKSEIVQVIDAITELV